MFDVTEMGKGGLQPREQQCRWGWGWGVAPGRPQASLALVFFQLSGLEMQELILLVTWPLSSPHPAPVMSLIFLKCSMTPVFAESFAASYCAGRSPSDLPLASLSPTPVAAPPGLLCWPHPQLHPAAPSQLLFLQPWPPPPSWADVGALPCLVAHGRVWPFPQPVACLWPASSAWL